MRQIYWHELEQYINYQGLEQKVRLENHVPTIEEYKSVRPFSSGASQELCYIP
jgi:hypothetical protein